MRRLMLVAVTGCILTALCAPAAAAAPASPTLTGINYVTAGATSRLEVTWIGNGGTNFSSYQLWYAFSTDGGQTFGSTLWTAPNAATSAGSAHVASNAAYDTEKGSNEGYTATGPQSGTVELPPGHSGKVARVEVRATSGAGEPAVVASSTIRLDIPTLTVGTVGYDSIPVTVSQAPAPRGSMPPTP